MCCLLQEFLLVLVSCSLSSCPNPPSSAGWCVQNHLRSSMPERFPVEKLRGVHLPAAKVALILKGHGDVRVTYRRGLCRTLSFQNSVEMVPEVHCDHDDVRICHFICWRPSESCELICLFTPPMKSLWEQVYNRFLMKQRDWPNYPIISANAVLIGDAKR
jgi:hypothetical protein